MGNPVPPLQHPYSPGARHTVLLALLLLAGCGLFGQTTFPKPGVQDKDNVYHLIRGATLHRGPGTAEVGDLLIYHGTIVGVGLDLHLPENTVVHPAEGMHVFPSFLETVGEYGLEAEAPTKKTEGPHPERGRDAALYWNQAWHPEVEAVERFAPDTATAAPLWKKGVGAVLTYRHDGIARGSAALVLTGEGNANQNTLKAQAAMGYSFDKGSSPQDYPKSLMGAVALMRQAFYDEAWYAGAPRRETNFSLRAGVQNKHLPKVFEARGYRDIERISRVAREFDLSFVVQGSGDAYRNLPGTEGPIDAIIAPLKFPDPFDVGDPEATRFISQTDLLHWERAPYNPGLIAQNQIPLILSLKGLKGDQEVFAALRKAIASGLDPDTAIAALTTVPSRTFGVGHRLGRLDKGFEACFFITNSDPLTDDKSLIYSHWIAGTEYVASDGKAPKLAGRYNLNLNARYLELVVGTEGTKKAHIEEIADGDTVRVTAHLRTQGREAGLSFANPGGTGSYRLSATMLSNLRVWDGYGTDPRGRSIAWTAIRVAGKDGTSEKPVPTGVDSIAFPPPPRTPLTAYGMDSLPGERTLLIQHATLWTNEAQGVVEDASLLISHGKIVAVGKTLDPAALLPDGKNAQYETLDVQGKHITPGIVDEHSHIAIEGSANEGSQSSSAEVRVADAINPTDINIFRQLAGGVTTSQLLHGSANPIGGQSAIVKLRWGQSAAGMLFDKAPPFIKFALGENVKQSNWGPAYTQRYPQTRMGVEQFFRESFLRAEEYGRDKKLETARRATASTKKGRRWKRNKKKTVPPSDFRRNLELDALLEILHGERHITCHSYVQSEMEMLLHLGDSLGFKVNTFTHGLEAYKIADDLKKHGTAVGTFSDWWAYKYEVRDAIPYNAAVLNRMGVLVAINSDDAEMGRRLNQEAAKTVRYGGLSEEEALKTITLNPAKMLHIDTWVGSLAPGKDADFVIWSDHPLSVSAKALKTFVDGRLYFDRSALDATELRDQTDRARIANAMLEAKRKGDKTRPPRRNEEPEHHCDSP